jgi:hypothetical protein
MTIKCFILGHKEHDWGPFESPPSNEIYCVRCGDMIHDSDDLNPDLSPSLYLAERLGYFASEYPIIERCSNGHIATILGRPIGNHDECDIPF